MITFFQFHLVSQILRRLALTFLGAAVLLVPLNATSSQAGSSPEPNAEIAAKWWPPMRNVWTPVGAKSHPFRFNVLYNGTIMADPHPLTNINGTPIKEYLKPYEGLGVQLSYSLSTDGSLPAKVTHPYQLSSAPDGGVGIQGWDDRSAPLLWTRWPGAVKIGNTGVVLRQEVFARTSNSTPVRTGKEPLYGWVRLLVEHVDPLEAPQHAIMMMHVGNVAQMQRSMWHEENLTVHPDRAVYPRVLTRDTYSTGNLSCCRLVEPDGKIRLVAMMSAGSAMLEERGAGTRDYFLVFTLPAVKGTHIDMLVPMVPGLAEDVAAEANVGFDEALAQNDRAWEEKPDTAATFDTPEPQVNAAVRRLTEIAQVVAETNPETGEKALLTGSWNYDTLWPTPACMAAHMLLDLLGYHDFVADHLEIFRRVQGTAKPPGAAYSLHPGYLGAPRNLSSVDWLTDHGSILHSVATNALLSGDTSRTQVWINPIVNACEFLRESRAKTNHDGVKGVLPPAVATDTEVPQQAVWNIAWNYKGLTSAVELLQRMKHPKAADFEKEANEYKQAFVSAFRDHTHKSRKWTDQSGKERSLVPTTLWGPQLLSHPFFLDTGPMVLAYAGLVDGKDPLMQDSVAFYREGPNTKIYDPRGNMHQRAVLVHEISSCEPCYSFNISCSWQAMDRAKFLEGMYSLLVASISDQTFSGCEHRHGIYGLPAPGALMFYMMRLAVIDDELEPDKLHLLRLAPLAWVKSDYQTRFEKMPTRYGPVTLKLQLDSTGKVLNVTWKPQFRDAPASVVLHVPPVEGLESVVVNSVTRPAKPGDSFVLEPGSDFATGG